MASDTEEQQVVPKSKWPEFLRPNRGWFLAAAGGVTAYIIGHLDAPLWLALAVLVLLLVAGGMYPWISKNKKRYIPFWAVLFICAVPTAVVVLKSSGNIAQPPKKESPAFAVDIEHRIFTVPGPYGTSFWFGSFGFSSCSLEPTGAAIFLRITNLQRHKEMITAYSIDGLAKTPVTHGRMFIILPKGQIGSGFTPHIIDWGAPAGLGAMVHFPVDDADTSKAIPVTGDFLDYKIGEGHYLEPDEAVRGWVFFEYRKGYVEMPAHLTIKVTDQFQYSFTYPIPDHVGDPAGDILPRRIVEGPLEDLSRCVVYK